MINFFDKPDFLAVSGSHLYGCATPKSDTDYRGFVIEPLEYLIGRKRFDQHEIKEPDQVVWGARKFIELLEKGAPNASEILFAPENCIKICSEKARLLINNKDLFVTKKLTSQIRGFASSEWMKTQLVSKDKETGEIKDNSDKVGDRRRNDLENFGYSVKNGYHSIRLLDQGVELLKTGTLLFPRHNVPILQKIRNGEMSFEELSSIRENLAKEFEEIELVSKIPERVDSKKIDDLYLLMIEDSLKSIFKQR